MSMQYQGFCDLAGTRIFVTGAEITITRAPIAPELVWGHGWKVNYATGQKKAEFSITFPLFSSYITKLKLLAFHPGRDNFFAAVLDNGGVNVEYAECKCQSISFSADAMGNTPVMCTMRCVGKDGVPSAHADSPGSPTQGSPGTTPIPSYAITMTVSGGDVGSIPANTITRFDVSCENNPFRLFTLNGEYTAADIQEGLQGVTGSFSYYSGAANVNTGAITNGTIALSGGLALSIPSFLVTSDSHPISNPSEKPMRILGFEAFGNATTPPIS